MKRGYGVYQVRVRSSLRTEKTTQRCLGHVAFLHHLNATDIGIGAGVKTNTESRHEKVGEKAATTGSRMAAANDRSLDPGRGHPVHAMAVSTRVHGRQVVPPREAAPLHHLFPIGLKSYREYTRTDSISISRLNLLLQPCRGQGCGKSNIIYA